MQKGGLADKILDKLSYVRNSMNLVTFYTDNWVFLKMSKHGNPEKLSARSQCVYGTVVFHSHERSSAVTVLLCKNDERA